MESRRYKGFKLEDRGNLVAVFEQSQSTYKIVGGKAVLSSDVAYNQKSLEDILANPKAFAEDPGTRDMMQQALNGMQGMK